MRLRNIPRAESVLEACKEVVKNPESLCGHWNQEFQNERPLHIEIGMGKGQFILTLAEQNPDINYIGIERYSSVLLRAVEKLEVTSDSSSEETITFPVSGSTSFPFADFHCCKAGITCGTFWPTAIISPHNHITLHRMMSHCIKFKVYIFILRNNRFCRNQRHSY